MFPLWLRQKKKARSFLELLRLFFLVLMGLDNVIDDEENDKPSEKGNEKIINHLNVPHYHISVALIKNLFHAWNI